MRFLLRSGIVFSFVISFFTGCKSKPYSAASFNDPLTYISAVRKLNDVVVENIFSPVVASRNYTYANIAAYEIASLGNDSLPTLYGKINGLPSIPKPEDITKINQHFAALWAFCKVGNAVTFPEGSMGEFMASLEKKADEEGMPGSVIQASKAYADMVGDSIMQWAKGDNYARTRSASKYAVSDEENRWAPTPPGYSQAIEPHWNEIRSLLLDSASQFVCQRPPVYDVTNKQSKFYKEVMLIKTLVDSLTDEQKHIAKFWDDNPFELHISGHVMYATKKFSPPGHWMNIIGVAAKQKALSFNQTIQVYTYASVAIFESFIVCWDEKYKSNYVRPETVINKYIDPEWRPFIQTPPFPEYTSGHAVMSASLAEVLTRYFGDNYKFSDTTQEVFDIKQRNFTSFRQAAAEAGMSRCYGGIHFLNTFKVSDEQGKMVGQYVIRRLDIKPVN
ncbi:MAG: vanadium-dependent haloperoxidase [Ferruginibacter sp.]